MRRRGLLGLPSALAAPLRLLVLLALLPVTRAIYTLEMFRQPSEAVAGLPFGVQPAVALYERVGFQELWRAPRAALEVDPRRESGPPLKRRDNVDHVAMRLPV